MLNPAASKAGRLLAAAVCAGVCLHLLCHPAVAGEKIQITKTPGSVDLPQNGAKESPDSGLFQPKISPSDMQQGPILPMPSQPSYLRNPMVEEWYDRKKNWMLNSPSSIDRDKTLREIFGVREYDTSAFSKKPKGDLDRLFDDSSRNSRDDRDSTRSAETDANGQLGQSRSDDATSRYRTGDDLSKGNIPSIIPALNPAPLFKWDSSSEIPGQEDSLNRNSILPATLSDPLFGQKPLSTLPAQGVNPSLRTFDPMFDPRKGMLTDPINSQVDGTRFAINPTAARRSAASLSDSSSSSTVEPMVGFASPALSSRPDIFNSSRGVPGAAGFSPNPLPPAGSQVVVPKPAILEIPRPRF